MRHIPYTLLILAATAGFASAQATSYSTPVGYVTITTPATADSTLGVSISRDPLLQTIATGHTGPAVTIKASGLAANDLQYVPVTQPNTYYLLFRDGTVEGQYATITGNSASNNNGTPGDPTDDTTEVTLDATLTFAGTPSVAVVPYWTPKTLFPNGEGVGSTSDVFAPSSFLVFTDQTTAGIDLSPAGFYFYHDGTDFVLPAGWYDNGNPFAGTVDDNILRPDVMLRIRNVTGVVLETTIEGTVPSSALTTAINTDTVTQDNYAANPFPIDITLPDLGLLQSGAVSATSDVFTPVDFVITYDETTSGFDKSVATLYFYHDGTDFVLPAGWYDNGNPFAGSVDTLKVVKACRGVLVRKAPGTPSTAFWTAPLPYPAP